MCRSQSFHSHKDGRGYRRVRVNGNEISCVRWCDVASGIVIYVPQPARIKKPEGDIVYTRALRGVVTVEMMDHGL